MGLYLSCLSKPITDKFSTDESNNKLNCGISAMQGWREDQEDAHNCILDYDTDTSYFAVYDGHGGGEVAKYCANYLPDFIKELEDYKNGNLEKALEDAFLQFDATIISEETNKKLMEYRKLAHKNRVKQEEEFDDDEIEEEDEEHVKNLYEEATMPIEKVLEKLKAQKCLTNANTTKKDETLQKNSNTDECSTSHTPESSGEVVSSTSTVISSKSDNSKDIEKPVSSGSCSKESTENKSIKAKKELKVDSPDSSGDTKEECTPSDETDGQQIKDQNGVKAESTPNCESTKADVTSSSTTVTAPLENGEVIKKGKGKALMKTKGVLPKPEPRPKRTALQIYNSILSMEDCSDEESEDEKDETFEGQNGDSSDDVESKDDEEEKEASEEEDAEDISDTADVEDNSDESSTDDVKEKEEEDDDEEEEEEEGDEESENDDKIGTFTGSTAVVAILKGNQLYVANAGDSRCVVSRNGQAIEMSFDHKPEDKPERTRILKAGGHVDSDGRVNGGLNLSRAIGDFHNKKNKDLTDREQMITALPDIKTLSIKPGEDEFIVLACDGIWNSMSSQEVVDYVRWKMLEGRDKISKICEEMFNHCLAPNLMGDGAGCDNMTAIIVKFKSCSIKRPSSPLEELEHNKKLKMEMSEET